MVGEQGSDGRERRGKQGEGATREVQTEVLRERGKEGRHWQGKRGKEGESKGQRSREVWGSVSGLSVYWSVCLPVSEMVGLVALSR